MKKVFYSFWAILASLPASGQGTDAILRLRDERKRHPEVVSVCFPGNTVWREAYDAIYSHGAIIENPYTALRVYMNASQAVDAYLKQTPRTECRRTGFYSSAEGRAKGDGADVLRVGPSIGAGSFRGFDGTAAVDIEKVASRGMAVVDSATIEVTDRGWLYNGHRINVTERYTAHPDTPVIDVEVRLDGYMPQDLFCTGVQKLQHDNTGGFEPCTAWSQGTNAPDSKQPGYLEAVALRVSSPNTVRTVETALDYLLILRPDKDGVIRYSILVSRPL